MSSEGIPHPDGALWKVLCKAGLMIHHAPSGTSDTNGSLRHLEVVQALEIKNEWIRHARGWSAILKHNTLLMEAVEADDQILDACIYKPWGLMTRVALHIQFSGLREEITLLASRTRSIMSAREEYGAAATAFATALAVLGSHSKAPVKTVETVQRFFTMQAKVAEYRKTPTRSIQDDIYNALQSLRVDCMMIGKSLQQFQIQRSKIIGLEGKRRARVIRFGEQDEQASRLAATIKGLSEKHQICKDQLVCTISSLIKKKENLLSCNLGLYFSSIVSTCKISLDTVRADEELRHLDLDTKEKPAQVALFTTLMTKFNGHVNIETLLKTQPRPLPVNDGQQDAPENGKNEEEEEDNNEDEKNEIKDCIPAGAEPVEASNDVEK
eukprot:jgi/Bigna1/67548/fgenesh1_pg.4_\